MIEFKTSKGLAYALYSHKDSMMGCLIRIFNNLYDSRPTDFTELVLQYPDWCTFFPVGAAVNRGIVAIAGHVQIPSHLEAFPTLRYSITLKPPESAETITLWDGKNTWKVQNTPEERKKYSIISACNDTIIIERLENGYKKEYFKR